MSDAAITILVPVISGLFTLAGVILTIRETSHKQTEAVKDELKSQHEEFKVEQAVMTEQISGLRVEVEKHNNFGMRIPVIEEQIKVINHRLSDLEREDDRK